MKIYNYQPTTKEYLGESIADKDPLDDTNWLIPANAVTVMPPVSGTNEVAVYDKAVSEWRLLPDYRNIPVWDAEGNSEVVISIGDLPEGFSFTKVVPLEILLIGNDREAYRVIVAKYPEWKQRNALARATELNEKMITSSLTVEEIAEMDIIKAMWGWVKTVRTRSDEIATELRAATDPMTVVIDYSTIP
jgi:hypothetical protein